MYGTLLIIFGGLLAAGWASYFGLRYWRRRRYRRLSRQPLSAERLAILERNVSLYHRMPDHLRRELQGYVNVFLADKQFVGCDGLEVTEEMRITIAGNACLLLLNRAADHFPGFRSVLVYPDTYVAVEAWYDGNVVSGRFSARAGESWHAGPLVLSWADVSRGIADPKDGHNVVLHEFAHKLDEENGIVDGLPILRNTADYTEWARVLTREYDELIERVRRRKNRVLDSYAASSPPEFFAVATEAFFERGGRMRKHLPELYAQLQRFYGVDPADWRPQAGGR